ncbi:hypothetical protein ACFVUW_28600 [Streptomyces xiamenensis]|uniref:hypothetical protein n=1 Tax=Streptomyces xiamenensis TaxID=408015 RepID=UPI0036E1B3DF
MPDSVRRPVFPSRSAGARWRRWGVLYALPSAAVALSSAWLYHPHTLADLLMATGMVTTAVLVFTATMPRRTRVSSLTVRQADLTVVDADPDPDGGTPSDIYELRVFDVSVLVRLREQWKGQRLVPYVHVDIEHEADRPRLLLVEVDNQGESEHR